jgi:glycogen synthase
VHTWYRRPEAIARLVQNAMQQRFTWDSSARKYAELYQQAVIQQGAAIRN